jgi:D-tyrosyl-tRNA(Tyr) deacylase
MKLIVQRVKNAKVDVNNKTVGKINEGFLVLLGVKKGDTKTQADYLADKLCNLRVFTDENNKMNLSIQDIKGELLIISQFTIYADCTQGNRPSFIEAGEPAVAEELYEYFKTKCKEKIGDIQSGIFRCKNGS